jgi:hypothetical protein
MVKRGAERVKAAALAKFPVSPKYSEIAKHPLQSGGTPPRHQSSQGAAAKIPYLSEQGINSGEEGGFPIRAGNGLGAFRR